MSRYACLFLNDVALAAALRAEPDLRGRPLAVTDRGSVVSGFLRGLSLAQAQSVEPDLVARPLSIEGVHSAQAALIDVALSITPRVQEGDLGRVWLDLSGTRALFPTVRGLATALETRLATVGLHDLRFGAGPTMTVAELAARHREGGAIIEDYERVAFLGPLPLDLLEPEDTLFESLSRWGVRTLGELAHLPRSALGARLGADGVSLAHRARGEDAQPFRATPPRLRFEESAETGYPLDNLEALSFPLRSTSDRLGRRLRVRGLAVRELRVELKLESGLEFARTVELGAPTTEAHVLTSLVRLALEKDPPQEPVEALRLIATPGRLETAQLDLFLPPLPAPAELAITVARLEALCGPGRVGAPGVEDSHRPDAARLDSFDTAPKRSPDEQPEPPAPAMALRALRPPRAVRVALGDGVPLRVELAGRPLRVLQHAGPWRLFGEWWGESRFARDYYDLELSDRAVVRAYHNLADDSWYVDGVYD